MLEYTTTGTTEAQKVQRWFRATVAPAILGDNDIY